MDTEMPVHDRRACDKTHTSLSALYDRRVQEERRKAEQMMSHNRTVEHLNVELRERNNELEYAVQYMQNWMYRAEPFLWGAIFGVCIACFVARLV